MSAPTILFVSDDEEISEGIRRQLEEHGYRVVAAFDETESMDLLRNKKIKIDLILIDQKMASDKALAAARRIREHENVRPAVPVDVIPFEFRPELEGQDECCRWGRRGACSSSRREQQVWFRSWRRWKVEKRWKPE